MRIFLYTAWETPRPGSPERLLACCAAEIAARAGEPFAFDGFLPLERLAQAPEGALAWVIASRERLLAALDSAGIAAGAGREAAPFAALLLTPRSDFWERPAERLPVLADPAEPTSAAARDTELTLRLGRPARAHSLDWPAAFFSILQRAEEYAPGAPRDAHGRFPHWASELHRRNWLQRPIADEIARRLFLDLGHALADTGSTAKDSLAAAPESAAWGLALSYDVDSLRYWTWRRLAGRLANALTSRELPGGRSASRQSLPTAPQPELLSNPNLKDVPGASLSLLPTLLSSMCPACDPHWPFRALRRMERERGIHSTVFAIPEKTSGFEPYDLRRWWAPGSDERAFARELRRWRRAGAEIGIHAPYNAMERAAAPKLARWRERLERAAGARRGEIRSARHHWLRFQMPEIWPRLAAAGITVDSSLGYSHTDGFRCGTCHPFQIVNLHTGEPLELIEVPLIAMDVAYHFHLGMPCGQALARIENLMESCRREGGIFSFLWHTNSFDPEWAVWREVFRRTLDSALSRGARSETIHSWAARHGERLNRVRARMDAP